MTSYISRKTFNKDWFNSLPIFTIGQESTLPNESKPALAADSVSFTENMRLGNECRRQS